MQERRAAAAPGSADPGRRWTTRDTAGAVLIGVVVLWTAAALVAGRSGGFGVPVDAGSLLACATFLGTALVVLGAPRRTGDTLHCVRCEHQVPPAARAAHCCPECGADLRPPGTTAQGRRRPTRWLLGTGGALLVAVAAGVLVGLIDRMAPTLRWRHAPLPVVLRDLRDPAVVVSDDEWTAVTGRGLDATARRRVIAALLDRRAGGGYLPGAGAWIERTLVAMPDAALRDRFLLEGLAWEVSTDRRTTSGDDLHVSFRGRTARWGVPDGYVVVWLVAARFNGEAANRVPVPRLVLGGPADRPEDVLVGPGITISTTGLAPGPRSLRLDLLFAAGPRRLDPSDLAAAREPGRDPAGVVWHGRRTVERTVVVE